MGYEQQYFVQEINMETILQMKFQLKQQQLLEPVLSTNLDYAASVITCMPSAILSEATLCITGESVLVKIVPDNYRSGLSFSQSPAQPHQSHINFTVISNKGQPQLIRRVTCGDAITKSDIKHVHFVGHSCQDMLQSCFQQAVALVGNRNDVAVLQIICNSLSLTYSIGNDTKNDQSVVSQSPQTTQQCVINSYIIKTECRLLFQCATKMEQLLKAKCWIEQEKPQKNGLIACMDYLLKQFTELPNAPKNKFFILQSEGEVVQIFDPITNQGPTSHYIFDGPEGVSMFPDKWQ